MQPKLKRLLGWVFLGGLLTGGLAGLAGFGVGYLSASSPEVADRIAAFEIIGFGVFGLIAVGVSLWVSAYWMRTIDEAAREAHKAAWFWGGSGALLLGLPLMLIATLPQTADWRLPDWFYGRNDPVAHAALGAGGLLVLMLAGYTVAWAWWWFKRR